MGSARRWRWSQRQEYSHPLYSQGLSHSHGAFDFHIRSCGDICICVSWVFVRLGFSLINFVDYFVFRDPVKAFAKTSAGLALYIVSA